MLIGSKYYMIEISELENRLAIVAHDTESPEVMLIEIPVH